MAARHQLQQDVQHKQRDYKSHPYTSGDRDWVNGVNGVGKYGWCDDGDDVMPLV